MDAPDYSHNGWLDVVSLCVAFLAGFTGLSLTHGLRGKPPLHRKLLIAMAAIALGGGIRSMHFVAMLGLRLPILFYYDAAITLMSALVAILVVGAALLILHFYPRTNATISRAVVLVGAGILAAFLLTSVTYLAPAPVPADPVAEAAPEATGGSADAPAAGARVPYESGGRTHFVDSAAIAVICAEGHYTHPYTAAGQLFCVWSITEAEKRLKPRNIIRGHRSYLINPDHVSSLERLRDTGLCHFDSLPQLRKVPVSRSHLRRVRAAPGL